MLLFPFWVGEGKNKNCFFWRGGGAERHEAESHGRTQGTRNTTQPRAPVIHSKYQALQCMQPPRPAERSRKKTEMYADGAHFCISFRTVLQVFSAQILHRTMAKYYQSTISSREKRTEKKPPCASILRAHFARAVGSLRSRIATLTLCRCLCVVVVVVAVVWVGV